MEPQLLWSYTKEMFWDCTRLNHNSFTFLVSIVEPFIQMQNTHFQNCIIVETCIAGFLSRLGYRNTLTACREPFGV